MVRLNPLDRAGDRKEIHSCRYKAVALVWSLSRKYTKWNLDADESLAKRKWAKIYSIFSYYYSEEETEESDKEMFDLDSIGVTECNGTFLFDLFLQIQ